MNWKKINESAEEKKNIRRTNTEKNLDEMIADYHGDEFWDAFNDVLASYGVECTNDVYADDEGYWRFLFPVTGYWENDGIGSYEYWGSRGYDAGTNYFVVEDLDFNYDKLNDELFEKFGIRIDWYEPKDEPESDDGHTGDGYYFVSVDDEAKLRTWLDKVVTEETIPQELRDKAMTAQRILRNNASLSDSELKSFIRRARMMHRDELAQAAEDLLEYRTAAQGVTGDRETGGFAGIVSDFDESSEGEEEQFNIPDSEWKKVAGYIKKGSDFTAVGRACIKNNLKFTSRFLILKALGYEKEAEDFLRGGNWKNEHKLKEMPVPEVPEQYQYLSTNDVRRNYHNTSYRNERARNPGPLKALDKMGIDYVTTYSDGSSSIQADKEEAYEICGGEVPKYRADCSWVGRSGLRWDIHKIVFLKNGVVKDTNLPYFGFVMHTLESDAPNPGYNVFAIDKTGYCYGEQWTCDSVQECMDWINKHVVKTEQPVNESSEDDEDDGWNSYYLEDTGLSYVLDAISDLDYEIKHCVRGGNTGCKTYEELGNYIISLGEQLSEAGEDVKYIR